MSVLRHRDQNRQPPIHYWPLSGHLLVVAGNRITEEDIPNTCAALAPAGFAGLAPDIFHPMPSAARTPQEMREALKGRTDFDVLLDVQVGAD
jgi:hypothetical protein